MVLLATAVVALWALCMTMFLRTIRQSVAAGVMTVDYGRTAWRNIASIMLLCGLSDLAIAVLFRGNAPGLSDPIPTLNFIDWRFAGAIGLAAIAAGIVSLQRVPATIRDVAGPNV
jgi:hypothetical protein